MQSQPLGEHDVNETIRHLRPLAAQRFMEECGSRGWIWYRWRRMLLRVRERRAWHEQSLLLWLQARSYLRFAPFPYPSVTSVEQWEEQARAQCQAGTLIGRHYALAMEKKLLNARNLQELSQFRNRCGWKLSFLEDPVLAGLLAARTHRGQASKLKQASLQELKLQAAAEAEKTGRMTAIRQLIGPRGGMPTLKSDLIKLAHLVEVKVDEKDTIPIIRAKVQPVVQDIAMTAPPPTTSVAAKSKSAPVTLGERPISPSAESTVLTWSAQSSPQPSTVEELYKQDQQLALREQMQFVEGKMAELVESQMGAMFTASENRMQSLLSQVVQHVMALAPTSAPLDGTTGTEDEEMFPPEMPR